jgi:hypothetical protein
VSRVRERTAGRVVGVNGILSSAARRTSLDWLIIRYNREQER